MNNSTNISSHRWLRRVSGIFLVISIIVFGTINFVIRYQDLDETYKTAKESAQFLEKQCQKYDNYAKGISAKSQQDVLDTAAGLKKFITISQIRDEKFLNDFLQTEHLGGVIILDEKGSVIAQADIDGKDSYKIWKSVLKNQNIKDIYQYPQKKYIDHLIMKGNPYDIAVVSDGENGVIFCYSSTKKPKTDPYEFTIKSFLGDHNFHKNPKIIITDKNKIVSSNDTTLEGLKSSQCKITKKSGIRWKENKLTKIKYQQNTWYGLHWVYNTYSIYIMYPYGQIFASQTSLIVTALMVYLAAGVIILSIQRKSDKKNLQSIQKQLRIINAVSTSYKSTILIHLDRMEMEMIKASDAIKTAYDYKHDPKAFLNYICETQVQHEYQDGLKKFLEIDTISERLQGKDYIGKEIKDSNGEWYSVILIAQRYDEYGKVAAVIFATRNVTAIKETEELSFKDKLTGLYNRNYMELKGEEFLRSGQFPISLIMADCNYLKKTNDTLGHEYGDLLLKRVARILSKMESKDCQITRVGGDEFLMLCRNCDKTQAEQRITLMKQEMIKQSDDIIELSVAFGFATAKDQTFSMKEIYDQADHAMYEDKMKDR